MTSDERSCRPVRRFGVILLCVGIAACESMSGPPPTGAQATLRQAADRFDPMTIATGCLVGALGGAVVGAAVAGKGDRGKGAAIGAGVGGAAGCAAGFYVSSANASYADAQDALRGRQQAAAQELEHYRQATEASRRVVAEHKQRIAQLNRDYRRGRIDADKYREQIAGLQRDMQAMQSLIEQNKDTVAAMERDMAALRQQGIDTSQLRAARDRLVSERKALQQQVDLLVAAAGDVPADVREGVS